MSFTSGIFLLFFAVLLVVYYLIPRRHQWKLLLLASYLFYAFAGWSAVCYLLATTVTTWLSARQIGKHYGVQAQWLAEHKGTSTREERKAYKAGIKSRARRWMLFGILFNFGMLAVVKYTDFVLGNVNGLLALFGGGQVPLALDELGECLPAPRGGDGIADELALAELLDRFLSSLPKERRVIFMRRYWYLSPVAEIAEDLAVSQSKVKMSLLRSRAALKQLLEKEGVTL